MLFALMLLAVGLDVGIDGRPTYASIGRATLASVTSAADPGARG